MVARCGETNAEASALYCFALRLSALGVRAEGGSLLVGKKITPSHVLGRHVAEYCTQGPCLTSFSGDVVQARNSFLPWCLLVLWGLMSRNAKPPSATGKTCVQVSWVWWLSHLCRRKGTGSTLLCPLQSRSQSVWIWYYCESCQPPCSRLSSVLAWMELIFCENSTKHSSPAVSVCMFCTCYLLEYFHMSVRKRSSLKLTGNGVASFPGLASALIAPDFAGTREQTRTLTNPGLSIRHLNWWIKNIETT